MLRPVGVPLFGRSVAGLTGCGCISGIPCISLLVLDRQLIVYFEARILKKKNEFVFSFSKKCYFCSRFQDEQTDCDDRLFVSIQNDFIKQR